MLSAANHDSCLGVAKIAKAFGNDHLIAPGNGKPQVFEHVTSGAAAKIFGGNGYCVWIKALRLG